MANKVDTSESSTRQAFVVGIREYFVPELASLNKLSSVEMWG
jgi:hypothetical protein